MRDTVSGFFGADHRRLGALLDRASARARDERGPGAVRAEEFAQFRRGILRHIALEEKLLIAAVRRVFGLAPLGFARQLRVEHGAIASLLVPTPTADLVAEIRTVLDGHNAVEEQPGGLYDLGDRLPPTAVAELLARARAYPEVKTNPHHDGPGVYRSAADALRASARQFGCAGTAVSS